MFLMVILFEKFILFQRGICSINSFLPLFGVIGLNRLDGFSLTIDLTVSIDVPDIHIKAIIVPNMKGRISN